MRSLPVADPGTPDGRSPTRYLLWLTRLQLSSVVGGMLLGIVWMVSQAFIPAVIGRAIDEGIAGHQVHRLVLWGAVLCALGLIELVAALVRHRFSTFNFLAAAYRTIQVTVRQAILLGATLPKRTSAGEIVSIGTSDISQIGNVLDISGRAAGSLAAIVTVVIILLRASVPLGLVVLIGIPVLVAIVALLIRPLHQRQQEYRDQQGMLSAQAGDIVVGLRVLRGIGGEATFARRYRARSQQLRDVGVHVARVESVLEVAQILLPGAFILLVTWLGARFAVAGRIGPGQLVAFYGYAAFLMAPLRTLTETARILTRAHVSATRAVRMLALEPELVDPAAPAATPPVHGDLVDAEFGVIIRAGLFTAIVTSEPREGEQIAERLGRYTDGPVTLCGVPLRCLKLTTVRQLILVADNDARLFTGPLRANLAAGRLAGETPSDDVLAAALTAASATDILYGLPEGLDTDVAERGREFSGGEQQRLRLARALVADPPILVLVEPTSAVDAHTETRIASQLRDARAGRTTVVTTASPPILHCADRVIYVRDGTVVAEGSHRDLLAGSAGYRRAVTRELG